MFAGNKRRSSNVKVMQLFYELKQQFPTIPDHVVTSCITTYIQSNAQEKNIVDLLETALAENNIGQMGRSSKHLESPPLNISPSPEIEQISAKANLNTNRTQTEMNESVDDNRNPIKPCDQIQAEFPPRTLAKRPNYLDFKTTIGDVRSEAKKTFDIQLSEKCKDVHKLLNSELSEKPPRSPLSAKRFAAKNSPTKVDKTLDIHKRSSNVESAGVVKKETCSTPTQTTDTLIGNSNLGLSLNVNCSVDVVQSPTQPKRTSTFQLTPSQPWLQTPTSPRSYTSVNLTLRPPTSTPQDPINITSQNSSLTYSTSSYDSQKGLQSRLQITVGPGSGSVSSLRVRPKSYHPQEQHLQEEVPTRAGSLNNLAVTSDPPVILKQQARIERLRIELKSEKAKLVIMKQEIDELEKNRLESEINLDMEKQLIREIKHLRYQCKELELDGDAFYNNIYTGQVINDFPTPPPRIRQQSRRRIQYTPPVDEGPKWNCDVCTFLNHPILDKCEQCDFPRILHGTKTETVNPNVTIDHLCMLNNIDVGRTTTRSLSLNNVPQGQVTRPIGFILDNEEANVQGHISTSRSVPNMIQDCFSNKNRV